MMLKGIQFSEKELCPTCVFAGHLSVLSTWDPTDAGGLERTDQLVQCEI